MLGMLVRYLFFAREPPAAEREYLIASSEPNVRCGLLLISLDHRARPWRREGGRLPGDGSPSAIDSEAEWKNDASVSPRGGGSLPPRLRCAVLCARRGV